MNIAVFEKKIILYILVGFCFITFVNINFVSCVPRIHCKDESGKFVDWWIIMKYPLIPSCPVDIVQTGYGYAYMDPDNPLEDTGKRLDVDSGSLSFTLEQLYAANLTKDAWIMYNDQDPSGYKYPSNGHTKGTIFFGSTGGFWLIHSIPRFPPFQKDGYEFPEQEKLFGQSILCVSYEYTTFESIGELLLLNKPAIYDYWIPDLFKESVPSLVDATKSNWVYEPMSKHLALLSVKLQTFDVFGKNAESNDYLYENIVCNFFDTDLMCETWMNGPFSDQMPTFCRPAYPYEVYNAITIGINDQIFWNETKDHSKWAIALSHEHVCIGDINRQYSQKDRGGGTACISSPHAWNSFKKLILDFEDCYY